MIERVPFDTSSERHAAFIVMHAMHTPWTTDEYPHLTGLQVPVTLMVHRADGKIGFPGGMADGDETPEEALVREAAEEAYMMIQVDNIEPLAAYREDSGLIVRTYTEESTFESLLYRQRMAERAKHFGSEITGIILPHLVDFRDYGARHGGLINVLRTPSASAVPYELGLLVQKTGFYDRAKIDALSTSLGYQLDYWDGTADPETTS